MQIGVVGAGIGGLAAAALLAQDGHDITVFDQFDHPAPVGSGLVVQPVGMDVLARIGTLDMALAAGCRITRMLGHEADTGRAVLDVRYTASGADRFGLALHRSVLFGALLHGARNAGVQPMPNHRVLHTTNDNRLRFADGATSDRFDLIIDAAGAASPLSPLQGKSLPFGALWGTVTWPDQTTLAPDHLSQTYRAASRMLGVLPIGQLPGDTAAKATLFWSLPADGHAAWQARPLRDWQTDATRLWPQIAPFINQISRHDQMTMAIYSHGTLTKPWRDGLVHIGDAAHRASPQLGQGANMALLDAWALAAALRQTRGREALALYVRLRRWHVRLYQGMSYLFTPQYQSHSRALPLLRDHVLAPMSQIWPLPRVLSHLVCGDLIQPYAGLPDR